MAFNRFCNKPLLALTFVALVLLSLPGLASPPQPAAAAGRECATRTTTGAGGSTQVQCGTCAVITGFDDAGGPITGSVTCDATVSTETVFNEGFSYQVTTYSCSCPSTPQGLRPPPGYPGVCNSIVVQTVDVFGNTVTQVICLPAGPNTCTDTTCALNGAGDGCQCQ